MKINDKYGKLHSGRLDYAPVTLNDNGRYIVAPTHADYVRLGYLPVEDKPPTEPAAEGYHWEATSWRQEFDKITRVYTEVINPPPAPRKFSKLKLYAALAEAGHWQHFEFWLKEQTIAGVNGYTAFSLAQELSDDHPLFASLYAAAKTAIGVSDEEAERILEAAREE